MRVKPGERSALVAVELRTGSLLFSLSFFQIFPLVQSLCGDFKRKHLSWTSQYRSVTPLLRRPRQEIREFKASLDHSKTVSNICILDQKSILAGATGLGHHAGTMLDFKLPFSSEGKQKNYCHSLFLCMVTFSRFFSFVSSSLSMMGWYVVPAISPVCWGFVSFSHLLFIVLIKMKEFVWFLRQSCYVTLAGLELIEISLSLPLICWD